MKRDQQEATTEPPQTCKFCDDVIMYCTCMLEDPGPYDRSQDGPAGKSDSVG